MTVKTTPLGGHNLAGRFVVLEPLAAEHRAALLEVAAPDIFTYMPVDPAEIGRAHV